MNRSRIYVLLATLGFSFILVFSTMLKNTGMSSLEQLVFRWSFALAILTSIMLVKGKLRFVKKQDFSFFALMGLIYSLFTFAGLSALAFDAPITVISSLIYTQPIFTTMIAHFTRKERVTGVKVGVILVGVFGAFLVSGLEITNLRVGPDVALPVFAGLFYAAYLSLKRQATSNMEYSPYQILFYTLLFALPFLFMIGSLLQRVTTNPLLVGVTTPSEFQLELLLLFAFLSTVLPYSLLNYVKVEELSPTSEGLLLLVDPLLHSLWAIAFFGQFVSPVRYVGAGLIILSAALNLKMTSKTM